MTTTRRTFLLSAAAGGAVTILPFRASADGHATADSFETPAGPVTVHPVDHASIVFETPVGVIYVDPVGEVATYEDMPSPDLVLITHEHGDHYNVDVLNAVVTDSTMLITNPAVFDMLPETLKAKASAMANGDSTEMGGVSIDAIPAHNLTADRMNFHPVGRDNGYVIGLEGFRIYVSGDTEDVPEMRSLENIDLAFVCMNLPFTMDKEAAASAVAEFAPTYVYPYHYRGRGDGTQDPREFAALVGDGIEVKFANWYGDEIMPA